MSEDVPICMSTLYVLSLHHQPPEVGDQPYEQRKGQPRSQRTGPLVTEPPGNLTTRYGVARCSGYHNADEPLATDKPRALQNPKRVKGVRVEQPF